MEEKNNTGRYLSNLEDFFWELGRHLHMEIVNSMVSSGITGSQFFVLKKICNSGRLTVSEVAKDAGVSLSAVTAVVNKLVSAGFVVRRRDKNDRRVVWLEPTVEGRGIMEKCFEARKKVFAKYFSCLKPEEIEDLLKIYRKVLSIMREEKAADNFYGDLQAQK